MFCVYSNNLRTSCDYVENDARAVRTSTFISNDVKKYHKIVPKYSRNIDEFSTIIPSRYIAYRRQ